MVRPKSLLKIGERTANQRLRLAMAALTPIEVGKIAKSDTGVNMIWTEGRFGDRQGT
jgi:hypothetical protein